MFQEIQFLKIGVDKSGLGYLRTSLETSKVSGLP